MRKCLLFILLAVILLSPSNSEGAAPYLKWRYFLGAPLSSSPAISDGKIYIGSPDWYVYCLNAGEGTVVWKYMADGDFLERPLLIGDMVIAGCYDGYLYFLNRSSGKLLGKFRTEGSVTSQIVAKGNSIYFGTAGGLFYSLEVEVLPGDSVQVKTVWKVRTKKSIFSVPVLTQEMVYFGSENGSVRGCSVADGSTIWVTDIRGAIDSPILLCEGSLILSSKGILYGVDASSGETTWKKHLGGKVKFILRASNGVLISGGTNGFLYALDPGSGKLLWKKDLGEPVSSDILELPDGRLLIPTENREVLFLRVEDGRNLWKFEIPGNVGGSSLWRDGTIYMPSDDGFLYSFGLVPPDTRKVEEHPLWDDWAGEYSFGSKVGYIHQWAEGSGDLIRLYEEDVSWEGSFKRASYERLAGRNGRLVSFSDRRVEGSQVLEVDGQVLGDSLVVVEKLAGHVFRKTVPFDSTSAIPELAERLLVEEGKLSPGMVCTLNVFSYSSLRPHGISFRVIGTDTISFGGKSTDCFIVEFDYDIDPLRGIKSIEWLDRDGRILKSETPYLGISYRLFPKEEALGWAFPEAEGSLFIDTDLGSPTDVDELRVIAKLRSGDIRRVFKSNHRQKLMVSGESWGEIEVTRPTYSDKNVAFDLSGYERYMGSNIYVQSDYPEIEELSRIIVGDGKDLWAASLKILEWVYNNMKPAETHVKFRSAAEILGDMEGTCSEYSVLFMALARAAGIPCRGVIGLAPMGGGKLGFHMWVQVYLGRWIDMDPTWNQSDVDASHIGISESSLDPEDMLSLNVPLQIAISNLDTLKVISYRSGDKLHISAVEKLFREAERLFDSEKAIELLSRISDYPENSKSDYAILKMGDIYSASKDFGKARELFKKVVSNYPSSDSAPRALFKLARITEEQGDCTQAALYLQQIASQYTESDIADDALCELGDIYERDLKNPRLARSYYSMVLEKYPDSGWAIIAKDAIAKIDKESRN